MKTNHLDRMIGHYCKIVINESNDKKAQVVTGIIQEIDYQERFIVINSFRGIWCVDIDAVIAIKPKKMKAT